MTPDIVSDATWIATSNALAATGLQPLDYRNSYELWASCRGGNVGAALREANNALTDPTTQRREGTVWVMIMLGDGAAGASDPARRFGQVPVVPQPYERQPTADPNIYRYGTRGEYGSLGLCPYGQPNTSGLAEVTDTGSEPVIEFPYCQDERPETRNFCYPGVRARQGFDSSVGWPPPYDIGFGPGALDARYADPNLPNPADPYNTWSRPELADAGLYYDIDVGNYPLGFEGYTVGAPAEWLTSCSLYYDVDDYARDWADFVGQIGVADANPEALPTIFTIGFGLNYDNQSDPNRLCENNVPDCLGEELLRYIADVGDNFQMTRTTSRTTCTHPWAWPFSPLMTPCRGLSMAHPAPASQSAAAMTRQLAKFAWGFSAKAAATTSMRPVKLNCKSCLMRLHHVCLPAWPVKDSAARPLSHEGGPF
ncbi:hypothetical protein HC928_14115 [bacterium]|nr:hypothetical protein [bacterium]